MLQRCVLSGQQHPQDRLLRLVALPEEWTPARGDGKSGADFHHIPWCVDRRGDLPGHSLWVYPDARIILTADTERILQVSSRTVVDFLRQDQQSQADRLLQDVRRSGEYCLGYDRIRQWWERHISLKNRQKNDKKLVKEVLFLGACDGGGEKIWQYLRRQSRDADYCLHQQRQLGAAFGHERLAAVLVYNLSLCRKLRFALAGWQQLKLP